MTTTPAVSTVHPDATTPPVETMGRAAFVADRVATYTARGVSVADVHEAADDAAGQGRPMLAGWYREVAARMGADVEHARADTDQSRLLRLVGVLAAVLLSLALVTSVTGWQPGTAPAAVAVAPVSPVGHSPGSMAPVGPVAEDDGRGALCDTDAHCAELEARTDYAAGRVPPVTFGPAEDGGTAVSCPDGWDVDGSSVLDAHCVPSAPLIAT